MPKKYTQYDVLFLRRVPRTLKAFFKASCAKRGKTMQEVLIEHMRQIVKTDSKVDNIPTKE